MQLLKYGTIGITSAAVITGVLWYARERHAPRIEDVAEIRSAVHERTELWSALNNDLPMFGTNVYVGNSGMWQSLYTEGLSAARGLATNVFQQTGFGDDGITIMWAAGALHNGMNIASADIAWTATTNLSLGIIEPVGWRIAWSRSSPTNIREHVSSTASIMAGADDILLPQTSPQSMPVASAIYGTAARLDADASIHGGTSSWWRVREVHTNSYAYSCEQWSGLTHAVTVQSIGGSSWTVEPAASSLIGQQPRLLAATDAVSTRSRYQAAALRLDTLFGSAYAVAYALPVPDPGEMRFIEIDTPTATLTEASTNQAAFRVRAVTQPLPGAPFDFAVTLATPSTLASVTPARLYFSNTTWTVWQTVYVNTGLAADGTDRAGIVRVGTTDYAALRVLSASGTPPPVSITPFFAEAAQNGSVSLAAQITTNIAPAVTYNQRIRTNNLNEARAVLEGLTRTWAFVDPASSYFAATSIVESATGGSTNFPTIFDAGLYAINDLHAFCQGVLSNSVSVYDTTKPIMAMRINGAVASTVDYYDDHPPSTTSSGNASISLQYADYLGCSFAYPSLYAITNGYVNSIRVYGVFSCATGKPIVNSFDRYSTNTINYVPDMTYPEKYESFLFGVIDAVRERPANPAIIWFDPEIPWTNSVHTLVERTGDFDDSYVSNPLVLLATLSCTNATARPLFDIRPRHMNGLELVESDYQTWLYQYASDLEGLPARETTLSEIKFDQRLRLDFFVLEIEWDFQHLMPGSPFEPTTNTPFWAQ